MKTEEIKMEMFIDQKPDKKQTYTGVVVVLVLLFVLGLLLTLTSATIGLSTANAEAVKNGGSMDPAMYQYIMDNTAESYRIVGAILAVITGIGAIMAGVAGYIQKKA
ncbi:MAG: hypothetical protein C0413_02880 [Clostridiales bacterium]|nr:hypothetical protein [Clostridiales bacterium]